MPTTEDTMSKRVALLVLFAFVIAACGGFVDVDPGFGEGDDAPAAPPTDESEGVVELETEAGIAAAELVAEPDQISPDGSAVIRVENRGDVDLGYGRPVTVERWDGEAWVETDESREAVWTMELLLVGPAESGVDQPWPFMEDQDVEPGWYRFTKRIHVEDETGDAGELIVRARVLVTE
jgi:hypothetical protein